MALGGVCELRFVRATTAQEGEQAFETTHVHEQQDGKRKMRSKATRVGQEMSEAFLNSLQPRMLGNNRFYFLFLQKRILCTETIERLTQLMKLPHEYET